MTTEELLAAISRHLECIVAAADGKHGNDESWMTDPQAFRVGVMKAEADCMQWKVEILRERIAAERIRESLADTEVNDVGLDTEAERRNHPALA